MSTGFKLKFYVVRHPAELGLQEDSEGTLYVAMEGKNRVWFWDDSSQEWRTSIFSHDSIIEDCDFKCVTKWNGSSISIEDAKDHFVDESFFADFSSREIENE